MLVDHLFTTLYDSSRLFTTPRRSPPLNHHLYISPLFLMLPLRNTLHQPFANLPLLISFTNLYSRLISHLFLSYFISLRHLIQPYSSASLTCLFAPLTSVAPILTISSVCCPFVVSTTFCYSFTTAYPFGIRHTSR